MKIMNVYFFLIEESPDMRITVPTAPRIVKIPNGIPDAEDFPSALPVDDTPARL
jgi:hypothetical protein